MRAPRVYDVGRLRLFGRQGPIELVLLRASTNNVAASSAAVKHITGAAAAAIHSMRANSERFRCLRWRASYMQTTPILRT